MISNDRLIKMTKQVAVISILILLYWVFIFSCVTVFNLKIFRAQMSEAFFISILGLIAVIGGAVVLNVMSSLAKISDIMGARSAQADKETSTRPLTTKMGLWAFMLSFPLITALLFGGHNLSNQKRERYLLQSAQKLIAEQQSAFNSLANYRFDRAYINLASDKLELISKTDRNLPQASLIVQDTIDHKKVFLSFTPYSSLQDNQALPDKKHFIFSTNKEERDYLQTVFSQHLAQPLYIQDGNQYQLFYPLKQGNQWFVLHFSDRQAYGKYGS